VAIPCAVLLFCRLVASTVMGARSSCLPLLSVFRRAARLHELELRLVYGRPLRTAFRICHRAGEDSRDKPSLDCRHLRTKTIPQKS
jgi:hypothetical protein